MPNKLYTENCYFNRPTGDECSDWGYQKVSNQLDYCEDCDKYYTCSQVSYLNDRLVELDKEGV